MMALKKKKTYEAQLSKLSGARMTIDQQLMAIEGAHVSLEAMNAMKMGASAMKAIHGEMYALSSAPTPTTPQNLPSSSPTTSCASSIKSSSSSY